jgi:O-antigen ligase
VTAIYRALADPSIGFEKERLGQSPTSLSVIAGIMLVVSLTLRSLGISLWPMIVGVIASAVMILAGGKAGIVSGVLSATLFYLLKKKLGSALAFLCGIVCLGFVLLLVSTPLNSYFEKYAESGQSNSLSGRTDMWQAALPAIRHNLVLGRGYMASRFASLEIGRFDLGWEADHMHNAFLDVLYNNGLVGLVLLGIVHALTVKNLLQVIRYLAVSREVREIAVASLAIYANLLINAFFNAIIGGRPSALFMIFLALFMLSGSLKRLTQSSAWPPRPSGGHASGDTPTMVAVGVA